MEALRAVTTPTRDVTNQSSELVDYNLFTSNPALVAALAREGSASDHERIAALGERLGTAEMFALGDAANRNRPVLKLFDRFGARRDEVEFHPAWHELMRRLVGAGLHTGPWSEPASAAHVARAAGYMLWAEVENGTQCPATMTYGAVPTLARQPEDFGEWLPLLLSREYDPRFMVAADKKGALMGMGMTEKQGGSDVRSNTTRAVPASGARGPGREYRLTGHKWFFSAPMCDAFLVLAQAPGGLSCFFVPRFLPDRTVNTLLLQRLKDKLGNHSNASSEVVFEDTYAMLVGEEGRGIQTILEMGVYTRFDNATATAGLMRQCVAQAIHHARQRKAFGKFLIDQPLMHNVLADLALECEAHIALVMRLARAFDSQDETAALLRRVLTPVAKYWVCKRAPAVIAETMEVLGGNGYVEEGPIARRFREAPLNSIWEGSGNIMCLDVLRAFAREARTREVLGELLAGGKGRDARYDRFTDALLVELADPADGELRARHLTQQIALAVQAVVLLGSGPDTSAQAFLASRLSTGAPAAFGTLPRGVDLTALIQRVLLA